MSEVRPLIPNSSAKADQPAASAAALRDQGKDFREKM